VKVPFNIRTFPPLLSFGDNADEKDPDINSDVMFVQVLMPFLTKNPLPIRPALSPHPEIGSYPCLVNIMLFLL
jgi:hypothetical protein